MQLGEYCRAASIIHHTIRAREFIPALAITVWLTDFGNLKSRDRLPEYSWEYPNESSISTRWRSLHPAWLLWWVSRLAAAETRLGRCCRYSGSLHGSEDSAQSTHSSIACRSAQRFESIEGPPFRPILTISNPPGRSSGTPTDGWPRTSISAIVMQFVNRPNYE